MESAIEIQEQQNPVELLKEGNTDAKNIVFASLKPEIENIIDAKNKEQSNKLAEMVNAQFFIESYKNNTIKPVLDALNSSEKSSHLCKEEIEAFSKFVNDPYNTENFNDAKKSYDKVNRLYSENILVDRHVSPIDAYARREREDDFSQYYPRNTKEIYSAITDVNNSPKLKWPLAVNEDWKGNDPSVMVFSAYNEPLKKLSNLFGESDVINGIKVYKKGKGGCSGVLTDGEKIAYEARNKVVIPSTHFRRNFSKLDAFGLHEVMDKTVAVINEEDYISATNKIMKLTQELEAEEELRVNEARIKQKLMPSGSKFSFRRGYRMR